MISARIRDGDTERIEAIMLDGSLDEITGLTTVLLSIRRVSDDYWYDFNDDTFKNAGWTTRQQQMTETDSTNDPGQYHYDFDTSAITNATADDTYMTRVDEATSAANVPLHGELKVDQWVDDLFDEHTATQSDIAAVQADTDNIQTRLPAALVGGRMDSDIGNIQSGAVDADAIAADAIGSSELATSAVNEIRDSILSDSTPFDGAHIDADISSRAAPGDAMDLVAGAVDATAVATDAIDADALAADAIAEIQSGLATSAAVADIQSRLPASLVGGRMRSHVEAFDAGVIDATAIATDAIGSDELATTAINEIRDAILSDSTPFNGANIDAAVSSRAAPGDQMALTAAAVLALVDDIWDEDIVAAHGGADTSGFLLRALGAALSQRANNPNLNALLGVADAAGVDLPEQIDTELTASHGAGSWQGSSLTQQEVRDAMKLSPTGGAPAAGSVDEHLDEINTDTAAIDLRLPADPADESLQQASHAQTQADIAALNDLSQADVQAAMTAQGYTAARAPSLDNLDATISSRATPADIGAAVVALTAEHDATQAAIAALNDLSSADVQGAMTAQGYTSVRAALLDNLSDLDASISSVLAAIGALNDISSADVQAAMTSQGYTTIRAALLDNLDAAISTVNAAIAALNDLSQADVLGALTAQGYTAGRAPLLDNLDGAISAIPAAVDVVLTASHGLGSWQSGDAAVAGILVALDESTQIMYFEVWLERNATLMPDEELVSCSVDVFSKDGALLFNVTSDTPDGNGRFSIERSSTTLTADRPYVMDVTVVDTIGSVQTTHAFGVVS